VFRQVKLVDVTD